MSRKKRVLVACEYSGTVRGAFSRIGWDAWSCDLLPTEKPGKHHCGDVLKFIPKKRWDLIIAHPPCTHLSVSGARHFKKKRQFLAEGELFSRDLVSESIDFFMKIANVDCEKIAIENPICIMSSVWRKPDQIIQPWQFGHGETKATCLWLKNLPKLTPTDIVEGRRTRIHMMPPGPNRWKERSRTFQGIADAMAQQWGAAT